MLTSGGASVHVDDLAAVIRGEPLPPGLAGVSPEDLLDACAEQDLVGLVYNRLSSLDSRDEHVARARGALHGAARAATACELVRQRETSLALDRLAAAGVHPILLKGTALAYSVYADPTERPRVDTDLLIRCDQLDAARRALVDCGYRAQLQCDGELLFRQFALSKTDRFGIVHTFDVHWKISTQAVFADLLTYDEVSAEAVSIERLGPHARAAGPVHALLLACVHPAMHHRNVEWLLWTYDVHLLASRLSPANFDRLVDLAIAKRVAAIAAQDLVRARAKFLTQIPDEAIHRLASVGNEPSASYLRAGRRWRDELSSNLRALSWRDRLRLLVEVLAPDRDYMLARYGIPAGRGGAILLPALYVHRSVSGLWNVLTGRK